MLEQKIEELTHAVKALTEAITRSSFMRAAMANPELQEPMPAADMPPEVPKAEKPKAEKPTKVKDEKPKPEPVKDELAYDQVAAAFKKYIAAAGRDQALELLATFDAKTLKDVPAAKWPLVMKACEQ